jgi:hypothetical protein
MADCDSPALQYVLHSAYHCGGAGSDISSRSVQRFMISGKEVSTMFKAANVIMAPNADPTKHRASVKGDKFEYTMVVIPLFDFDRAAQVCKDLVEKEGIQSISLCPGFSHEAVAKVRGALGEGFPINVSRGDVLSTMTTAQILSKEGWLPGGH